MSFFKKKRSRIIFFTKNSPIFKEGEYYVILSPQFYWIKRVELPVKSEFKARKLAPSVFEDILPQNEEYEYDVKYEKEKGTFIVIAYSKKQIYQELKEKFIDKAKIKGVFFAQYELTQLKTCIAITQEEALANVDGLLVQIPSKCIDSEENLKKYLPTVKLNSKKIKIENFENQIDLSTYIYFFIFITLLIASLLTSYLAYYKDIKDFHKKKKELLAKYHLPKTSFQLNSIKKELQKEIKEQLKIKNFIVKLDKVPLNKEEKYIKILATKQNAKVYLKIKKQRTDQIFSYLKKTFAITNIVYEDGILLFEVNL